ICFPASMAYMGSEMDRKSDSVFARHTRTNKPSYPSFQEWTIQGKPVGGYRNNAPQWYDMIGNTPWWNNARDAVGMHFWAQRLNDPSLAEKAERVINLTLLAPRKEGAFSTIYRYEKKSWSP